MRTAVFESAPLSVYDYRCEAGPADRPFVEVHARHSVSYVRRGSFGCRTLGEAHELVAGAVMVGAPGREYTATHEHHGCGDECLSFKVSEALADELDPEGQLFRVAVVPPLPELMVLGELAQAASEGRTGVSVEEAALLFVGKVAGIANPRSAFSVKPKDRRRAVEAALWIEENAAEPVRLEEVAREAGLSSFHFLRLFTRVTGVTPHQYLLRTRLRRAARLLSRGLSVTEVALEAGFADLSNFIRTFRRAAGMPPSKFSKNFQDGRAALA